MMDSQTIIGLGKKDNLFKMRFWNGRGSVTSFLVPCPHGGKGFCRGHLIYRDGRVRNVRNLDRAQKMRNGYSRSECLSSRRASYTPLYVYLMVIRHLHL